MPYDTQYNINAAQVIRSYSQKHLKTENTINDFSTNYTFHSMLDASVPKHPGLHGNSGFRATTVRDLGIEPTLGGHLWRRQSQESQEKGHRGG